MALRKAYDTGQGLGQVIQAGVNLEIDSAIATDTSSVDTYTTDSDAIQTVLKAEDSVTPFNISTDSAMANVFTTSQFTIEGAGVVVYLQSTSGSLNVQVAINKVQ